MTDIDLSPIKRDPEPEPEQNNNIDIPEVTDLDLFDQNKDNNDDDENDKDHIKNTIERRKVLLTIKSWELNFQQVLKDVIPSNQQLKEMTDKELDTLLDEIKFCVSVRNTTKISTKAFIGVVHQVENICVAYDILNIKGLTQICKKDQDLLDTVKEVCLNNLSLTYSKPEYRLAFSLLNTAYGLHIMNNSIKTQTNQSNKTIKKEMDDELKNIDNKFDELM